MAQTVLQQVLILSAMMMLGFLLGKLGKVDRKGAELLSMLLLDVFFPCNVLAAASGDFGDMPFSQVLKIIAAYFVDVYPVYLSGKAHRQAHGAE